MHTTRSGFSQPHAVRDFLSTRIGNLHNLNPKLLQMRIVQRRNAEMRSTRTTMMKQLSPLGRISPVFSEMSSQYEPYSSQRLIIGQARNSALKVQGTPKNIAVSLSKPEQNDKSFELLSLAQGLKKRKSISSIMTQLIN